MTLATALAILGSMIFGFILLFLLWAVMGDE